MGGFVTPTLMALLVVCLLWAAFRARPLKINAGAAAIAAADELLLEAIRNQGWARWGAESYSSSWLDVHVNEWWVVGRFTVREVTVLGNDVVNGGFRSLVSYDAARKWLAERIEIHERAALASTDPQFKQLLELRRSK